MKILFAFFFALMLLPAELRAGEARLYLEPLNPAASVALGDTLSIGVYIDAGALALTSASIYFSYDMSAFALVPERVLTDGQPLPFASGPFLAATVYENAVGLVDPAQLSYVAVSGVGLAGGRAVGSGSGLLASVRLRVIGYPAQGQAAVRLEATGQRQPSYTLLDEPGVERRFYVEAEPLSQTIEPEGLIALPDLELHIGETVEIDLATHYLSSAWASRDLHWQATVRDERGAVLVVEATKLRVTAMENALVDYSVETPDGTRRSGEFAVRVAERERYLRERGIDMVEDGGLYRRALVEYLIEEDRVGTWSVRGGAQVTAAIEDGALVVGAAADWAGEDEVQLQFCTGAAHCDSVALVVSVAAQNDAPTIVALPALDLVVGQRLVWPLESIFSDVDHALDELLLALEGGAVAQVYREADALVIEAVAVGVEGARLRVADPQGLSAETIWQVRVSAPSAGPRFLPRSNAPLVLGEEMRIDLKEYIKDDDTPLGDLAWSLRAEGVRAVWVDGEVSTLLLRATELGAATLYLTARDPEGNEAVAAWSLQVVEKSTEPSGSGGESAAADTLVAVADTLAAVEPAEDPREPVPGTAEAAGEMSWSLLSLGRLQIQAGEVVSLTLQSYIAGQSNGQVAWSVDSVPGIRVDLENSTAILRAENSYAGRALLLFSAVDTVGQRHSEVLEVEVIGGQEGMVLQDIPDVQLSAGTEQHIELADYVDRAVLWSVSGGAELDVSLVEDVAILRAPMGAVGRSVLLFSAVDAEGNTAADIVRVEVLDSAEEIVAVGDSVETNRVETETTPEELEPPREDLEEGGLELGVWPDYVLELGAVVSTQVLDELVLVGDAAAVQWSLRGGAFVDASIDASRRIVFDGRTARSGREVFVLKAVLGRLEREVVLGVQVREPVFSLIEPEAAVLAGANGYELAQLVRGQAGVIEWQAASEGALARIEEGRLFIEAAPGIYEVQITGRTISGRLEQVALRITVDAPQAAIPEPPVIEHRDPGVAPRIDMPEQIRLGEGESARWPLRAVGEDSAWGELTFSLVAPEGQARIEGAELLIETGAESFVMELSVRDEWGNTAAVDIEVQVELKDRTPPSLELVGAMMEGGQVAWTLRADEELEEVLLLVDHRPLPIQTSIQTEDGASASWLHAPQEGVRSVRVVATDRAGNTAQKEYDMSSGLVGGGFVLQSEDGKLRVLGGLSPTPALLYAEGDTYRLDFAPGEGIEVALESDRINSGLFYGDGMLWREIGAVFSADIGLLRAVLSEPGWLRAEAGQLLATAAPAALVYPNPFNATAAIRLYMPDAGLLRAVVYDVLGRRVRTLVEERRGAGAWTLLWRGRDERDNAVASGVYFVLIEGPGWSERARMLLLR